MSEIARLQTFVLWFISEPKQDLGALAPWRVKLAGNVIDPPTWCGAATTSLCRGRGDPHPLWRSSLVESGGTIGARGLAAPPAAARVPGLPSGGVRGLAAPPAARGGPACPPAARGLGPPSGAARHIFF